MMAVWFESLDIFGKTYLTLAVVGSFLFAIRVVLTFIGFDGDHDVDGDVDTADISDDIDGDGHADGADMHTEMSFTVLSFQGLTAFFMMFGWVGLALSRGAQGPLISLGGATAAGAGTVWITGKLFRFFNSLQHSGTINLRSAIHEEGVVYLTIPVGEQGKVQLNVQGRMRVMDAVTDQKKAIQTGSRVRVLNIVNDNILVVEKL